MMNNERRGFPWERLIPPLILLVLIGVGLYYGVILQSRKEGNERDANRALHELSAAEADFRANDRDANGVQDFWTSDVAGLYRFGLIDRRIAEADAKPMTPLVPKPLPFNGYHFEALALDASVAPPEPYAQDTDKKSGKVHHPTKFAFVAYPAKPGRTGRYIFIINENHSVFRVTVDAMPTPKNWPSDLQLGNWGKAF